VLLTGGEPERTELLRRLGAEAPGLEIVDRDGCDGGERFALRLDAGDAEAVEKFHAFLREHDDWRRVGGWGAAAGAVEMSLGAALHAGKVPFRGSALSALQTVVLTLAGERLGRRPRVVWVSFLAAGLKALSPAGNRLRPMLAITMQGVLYGSSVAALGWNRIAVMLGGALIAIWASAQGIVLQYLLIGSDLLRAIEALVGWITRPLGFTPPGVLAILAAYLALRAVVGAAVGFWGWSHRARVPARLARWLGRRPPAMNAASTFPDDRRLRRTVGAALRDLARPSFWLPILLVAAIVVVSGSPAERAFWIAGRALVVGMLLFSLARSIDPRRVAGWLRRRGLWGPAVAFEEALSGKDRTNEGDPR
jgi:hypothetical protein